MRKKKISPESAQTQQDKPDLFKNMIYNSKPLKINFRK